MNVRDFIFCFLIVLKNPHTTAFLNDAEQNISVALMAALSIDHRMLVEEPDLKLETLRTWKSFKHPKYWKATSYQNTLQFLKYFRQKSFPDARTLIVFKIEKLLIAVRFLKTLTKMQKTHLISKFTWLIFVDSFNFNEKGKNKLLVPYNCEFIVTYPINSTSYKLLEIYKIKSTTMTFDFGVWSKGKLIMTDIPWYWRRLNLKNETLVMVGGKETGEVGECKAARHCAYLDYLETLSSTMNFSLKWIKLSHYTNIISQKDKADLLDFPIYIFFHQGYIKEMVDVSSPIFKIRLFFYIHEFKRGKRADYYIQPFETPVWLSILAIIIVGGLTALLVSYVMNTVAIENREDYNTTDHVFMPFDCFCNQDGAKLESRSSSRILCFFIRFLALIIFGAYSANITSFSTFQMPRVPFRNLKEFIENEEYILGLDEVLGFLFTKVLKREKLFLFHNLADVIEKFCTEKMAFISSEFGIFRLPFPCKPYKIQSSVLEEWMVAAVFKGSPYKKMFDDFLINVYTSGARQRLYKAYMMSSIFKKEETMYFDHVEFEHTIQILAIFLTGAVISVSIILSEILFSHLKVKSKKS